MSFNDFPYQSAVVLGLRAAFGAPIRTDKLGGVPDTDDLPGSLLQVLVIKNPLPDFEDG